MADKGKQDGRTTLREIFAVMRTAELGPAEKVLWSLYRSYDGGAGAWPGDEALAAHMGKKLRSVESYRARLLDAGFLLKEFRGPKPAVYRAVLPQEATQDLATLDTGSSAESRGTGAEAPQKAPQDSVSPLYRNTGNTNTSDYSDEAISVFDYWNKKRSAVLQGRPRTAKATPVRLAKVKARLAEDFTVDELKSAVDGCLGNERNVEGGYIDLELICRDDQHVTQYMQWARTDSASQRSEYPSLREQT